MIEYELPWKLTDHQAEVLQRETIAILELLLARKSHTSIKTIRLIAMVECLAIFIAAFASREDDDQKMEQILDDLTDNLKQSVRHIKAAHSATESSACKLNEKNESRVPAPTHRNPLERLRRGRY